MSKKLYFYYLEWVCIVVYALQMLPYAVGKPFQFQSIESNSNPISSLNGFELMWTFYGYSKVYPILIGIFELLGIILLFPKKTRILGCLFSSILVFNIVLQDVIYGVPRGAILIAVFLQFLLLIILYINKEHVIKIWKLLIHTPVKSIEKHTFKQKIVSILQSVFTVSVLYGIFKLILMVIK